MSIYAKPIIKATKCNPEDAGRIEEIMRSYILGWTLDGISSRTFNAAAKDAKELMEFERSPDGIALAAQVEYEMLNPEKYR